MVWAAGGLAGPAVAGQVGADDRVPGGGEQGREPVPGGVRTRMAVQEQHGWAVAAVPDPQP